MAITAGLATYPLVQAGSLIDVTGPLALLGFLFVLLAVAWPSQQTGPVLVLLTAEYLFVEASNRAPTVSVIAYAAGLAILCEVLDFHGRLPESGAVDPPVIAEKLLHLGAIGLGAAVVAVPVLVVGGLRLLSALEAGFVGMTAAVFLCLIPWVLIQHSKSRS